jgi:hypothetical protein
LDSTQQSSSSPSSTADEGITQTIAARVWLLEQASDQLVSALVCFVFFAFFLLLLQKLLASLLFDGFQQEYQSLYNAYQVSSTITPSSTSDTR